MSCFQFGRRVLLLLPLACGLIGCGGGGGDLKSGTSQASDEDIAKAKAAAEDMNKDMGNKMMNPAGAATP